MNRNKYARYIAVLSIVVFCAYVAILLWSRYAPSETPLYFPPEHPQAGKLLKYYNVTVDASITYAPIIEGTEQVSDWHSALYMYECRLLRKTLTMIGIQASGIRTQIIFYYLHMGFFCSCVSILLYKTIQKNIWMSLLLLPLCLSTNMAFASLFLGLDFFFFVQLCIFCGGLWMGACGSSRFLRHIGWVIVLISLFHLVNYRKNAILLVPFAVYIYFQGQTLINITSLKIKAACWGLVSFFVAVFCVKLIPSILPVYHTDPVAPMLGCDLRIAAILRGEQEGFHEELIQLGINPKSVEHPFSNALTAYWGGELLSGTTLTLRPGAVEMYCSHWKEHTASMAMSRFIQTVEFYCGGSMPVGRSLIEKLYPALKNNPDAWKFLMRSSKTDICIRLAIPFMGSLLLALLLCKRLSFPSSWQPYDSACALTCIISLIYAGSFAVVPPTADARYLTPSLFLIWNVGWLWSIHALFRLLEKKPATLLHG